MEQERGSGVPREARRGLRGHGVPRRYDYEVKGTRLQAAAAMATSTATMKTWLGGGAMRLLEVRVGIGGLVYLCGGGSSCLGW